MQSIDTSVHNSSRCDFNRYTIRVLKSVAKVREAQDDVPDSEDHEMTLISKEDDVTMEDSEEEEDEGKKNQSTSFSINLFYTSGNLSYLHDFLSFILN